MSSPLLTAREVGALLGLSARAVYDAAAAGHLACYRLGVGRGAVRFDPADVEAYKAACRSTAIKPPAAGVSTLTSASTASAFGGASFSRPGGPDPKPTHSTARKARPCTRLPPASPSLGTTSTRLSIVTSESESRT